MMNTLQLCQHLIQFPSVTPQDKGIMDFLVSILEPMGFKCHLLPFTDDNNQVIQNLYARKGTASPNLCFAGHVDVVPTGPETSWTHPPFQGNIHSQYLWGRGTVDMKGSIAAFISATASTTITNGSISLMITGDEEGPGTHGTKKIIEWLEKNNETIDFCIVGEPTSEAKLGDIIKIGRRGSLNAALTVNGTQGHVAYPHKADNPIPKMLKLLTALDTTILDKGYPNFQPSNLEITSIDVGNQASNVIPQTVTARFNCRFNPTYTTQSLEDHLRTTLDTINIDCTLTIIGSSEPFLTKTHAATNHLTQAIREITGIIPELSTSGGTSDARYIHKIAPVVECGLKNDLAHKVDERVSIHDLTALTKIYQRFIQLYFNATS
ncbi:MAG: succinyl-diaminopimelate desuccinylase [Candidatus Paracaedibacteraceae bacterium]|nr:succinyl-diaminopimelate desuccinylase [Candidatus Paracaedibacteraceae bacterium]